MRVMSKMTGEDARKIDAAVAKATEGAYGVFSFIGARHLQEIFDRCKGDHDFTADEVIEYAIGTGLISLEEDFAN